MNLPAERIHKILVVTLSNLGDVVLTTPVFESLARAFPKARLDAAVGKNAVVVLEGHPSIRRVILLDKKNSFLKKVEFLREIRRERYDLIVDLRYSPIGLLGGSKYRNAYFRYHRKTRHRALKHLRALRGIAAVADSGLSFLERLDLSGGPLGLEVDPKKNIVTAAVGSKSDLKKWPAGSYAALLDRLALQDRYRIVLVGDAADAADAAKIKGLMRFKGVEDLCGRANFAEWCGILKRSSLVLTNDSASLHIADILKVPTLAFFGPTDPRRYGPRNAASRALRRPLFCSPCEKAQCRFHHECMTQLGVEEAYRSAQQILNDGLRPKSLKILVIRLDRIGDVVLSLPAISAVRERFPDASISLMVRPAVHELVEGHPAVDEVISYGYEKGGPHRFYLGYFRFLKEIISRRFDVAFVLHPSRRSVLIPALAGIPYRVGFDTGDSFLLTHKATDKRHEGKKHESEYTLDVVRAFGTGNLKLEKPKISISPSDREKALEKLKNAFGGSLPGVLLAVHAGASCPSKRWPLERFAELGRKVIREKGASIVLLGGAEEKGASETLAGEIGPRAVSLAGKLNLKESAAVLAQAGCLISNDSGPVHIAAAVGTRTVVIFGRNKAGLSPVRWKPLGEGHRWIQKDVGCQVCLAHRCPIEFECLKAVTVEEVFSLL